MKLIPKYQKGKDLVKVVSTVIDKQLTNPYGNLKFIRNLSGMPIMNGGRVQLGRSENGLVNLTSDLPFRLHGHLLQDLSI